MWLVPLSSITMDKKMCVFLVVKMQHVLATWPIHPLRVDFPDLLEVVAVVATAVVVLCAVAVIPSSLTL
jgi:hypothetical protein